MEEEKLTPANNFGCTGAFENLGKFQKSKSFKKPPLLRELTEILLCNTILVFIIFVIFFILQYFFPEVITSIINPIKAALTLTGIQFFY